MTYLASQFGSGLSFGQLGLAQLHESDQVETPFAAIGGFAFNGADLGQSQQAQIDAIARHLLAQGTRAVRLVGHTDPVGTPAYNRDLGQRRAQVVRQALSVALERIRPGSANQVTVTVESAGETQPLSKSPAPAERARDRRVEVFLPVLQAPDTIERICKRGLDLIQRLDHFGSKISTHQQQRIRCFLLRLSQPGFDDRYLTGQGVLDYMNRLYPQPYYASAKQWLLPAFAVRMGGEVSDQRIWQTLIRIDDDIFHGREKINFYYSHGEATDVRVRQLRDWVAGQEKNNQSIYWCYGRNAP